MTEEPQIPARSAPRRMTSRAWLHAAWTASLAGMVVVAVTLSRLLAPASPDLDAPLPPAPASVRQLHVAIARTPGGPAEWANWARIVKRVSDALGRPASLRYLTNEEEAVEVLEREPADIAFVCTHTYLDLRDRQLVVGLASPLIDGTDQDRMLLVVRDDSRYRRLEDLRDARLVVSQRTSLGGYAYAQWLAKSHGAKLDDLFGEVTLGDSQEQNLKDLFAGDADATIVNTAQVQPQRLEQLRIITESPPLGAPPVVVSATLDEETREKVLAALVAIDPSQLDPNTRIDGFVPLDETHYEFSEVLRNACEHHNESTNAEESR